MTIHDCEDPLHDFRDYHVIFLADVDGVIWASNSYWAVPVPDSDHRIARLFRSYNLPLEPGTFEVGDTLTPQLPVAVKDIKALVLAKIPEKMEKVERRTLQGAEVYVRGNHDEWLAVFDIPGGVAVVSDERLRLTEAMAREGEWYACSDPMQMLVRKTDDGRITAVLMPMRHKASGQ